MLKLAALIFIFTAPTIAGTLVIGVLTAYTTALDSATPIVVAVALGVAAAVPASWWIARAILRRQKARGTDGHEHGRA